MRKLLLGILAATTALCAVAGLTACGGKKHSHKSATPVQENVISATCTNDGSCEEVVYCSSCNEELSRTPKILPAIGHSFTQYIPNGDITCAHDETATAICDRVGCSVTDTQPLVGTQLPHTYVDGICKKCNDEEILHVTFLANGTIVDTIEYTVSTETIEEPQVPAVNGYVGSWTNYQLSTHDIYVNAVYTLEVYTITYVLDDAENNSRNPSTYTIESNVITLYAPENMAGLSFEGWYSEPTFKSENRVSLIPARSTGNLTFYAKFLKYRVETADGFTFDYKNYDYPALTQTVSATRSTIALSTTIKVSTGCTWTLSKDIEGLEIIKTKNMSLTEGHNYAYITVWYTDDYNVVYYLDIYRLGYRTYSFVDQFGVTYATNTIEEQSNVPVPNDPTKLGYSFMGWMANNAGGAVQFPYRLDYDTVFYPIFVPNTYTVVYDVNGGDELESETGSGVYDVLFTAPIPTRTGYDFLYWTDDEGNIISQIAPFIWKYTSTVHFTANWSPTTYIISYSLDGGTNDSTNPSTYNIESDTITFAEPTKAGYGFEGWFIDSNYTTPITEITTGSYGNKTVYAKWEPIVYSISYELNGGENNTANPDSYTIEDSTITLTTPTKTGYSFSGWFTDSNLSTSITQIEHGSYGEYTLYAKWTANKYIVTYKLNADSVPKTSATVTFDYNYTEAHNTTVTLNNNEKLTYPSVPTRSGYVFAGWYTTKSYSTLFDFTKDISDDVTIYAKWVSYSGSGVIPYNGSLSMNVVSKSNSTKYYYAFVPLVSGTVSVYSNGGLSDTYGYLYDSNKTQLKNDDDSGDGKNFKITYTVTAGTLYYVWPTGYSSSGNTTVYVSGPTPSIGGTFKSEVITDTATYDSNYTLLTDITKNGYTFEGWYIGEEKFEDGIWNLTENITLTARYNTITYYIEYVLLDGTNSSNNPSTYTIETDTIDLEPATSSKDFLGWCTDANYTNPITAIPKGSTGNIKLYAKWDSSKGLEYTLNGSYYTVSGIGTCTDTVVVISDSYNGKTVTGIGSSAFYGCSSLTSVVIGNGVTSIDDSAFYGCSSLTNISVGADNETYKSIDGNLYSKDGKTLVQYAIGKTDESFIIPDGITSIGSSAFYGCRSLTSIIVSENNKVYKSIDGNLYSEDRKILVQYAIGKTDESFIIPDSVTSIGSSAFKGCSSLTSVVIPDSVTSIGSSAFYNCSGLTSVVIPDSVKSIGSSAFEDCSSLESITLPFVGASLTGTSNTHFGYIFGAGSYSNNSSYVPSSLKTVEITKATSIGSSAFKGCSSLTSVVIPDSVKSIGSEAFDGCRRLVEVWNYSSLNIQKGSTNNGKVGYYALKVYTDNTPSKQWTDDNGYIFYEDGNICYLIGYTGNETELTLPENCHGKNYAINQGAFWNCSSLTSVVIPDSVKSIGSSAFYGCSSLTSVVIGSSVTSIGSDAFYNCSSLTSVNISSIESWCKISFGNSSAIPLYYAHNLYLNGELVTDLVIPDSVKSIGSSAFYGCSSLTSVVIPNSVTSIGSSAFYNCSSLTSVVIGDSVTSIGYNAFYGCNIEKVTIPAIASAYISSSVLKEVVITSGTSIGSSAFRDCSGLTSVVIPDSVTSIGSSAFSGCSSLKSITLPFVGSSLTGTSNTYFGYIFGAESYSSNSSFVPSSLKTVEITKATSIGSYAFRDCSSLTSVVIGSSVTSIGSNAFYGCSNLTSVNISSIKSWCKISFGNSSSNPLYYAHNLYLNGELVTSIVIPDSVTSIGSYAFYKCSGLTSVVIPNSVKSIGDYAFYGCSSLTSVVIPNSVKSIGDYAFYGCSSLTSVVIPNSVTSICNRAFYNCSNLTSVVIGNGVTSIGDYAFYGCSSLTSVVIPNSLTSIGSYAFYKCSNLTSVVIGNGVKSIGNSAFEGCSRLTSVNISSIESWCNISFSNEYSTPLYYEHNLYLNGELVTNLVIPDSVKSIGPYAFYNCSSLTSVVIPDGVTSIYSYAFYGCSSLTSVVIPNSVKSIGSEAFKYCSLTSVVIPNSVKSIGSEAFGYCRSLTSVVIPDSVTSIGSYAFSVCSSLTSVVIPNSVTSIGDWAFWCCYKLVEVWNHSSLDIQKGSSKNGYVGYYALNVYTNNAASKQWTDENGYMFYENGDTCYLLGYTGNETELTLPENCHGKNYAIYKYAFYNCSSLTSVVIPDSVTSIGSSAFRYCSSLTSVVIPDSVTSIGDSAFYNCSSLTSVVIPDSVTSIGSEAFDGCRSLTSVVIGSSVTSIGSAAFYNCSSLASVVIPDSVTSIGSSAFGHCRSLTSVVIPDSVTSIGDYAFDGCSSLKTVYYTGTKEQWRAISIGYNNSPLTSATIIYNYVAE